MSPDSAPQSDTPPQPDYAALKAGVIAALSRDGLKRRLSGTTRLLPAEVVTVGRRTVSRATPGLIQVNNACIKSTMGHEMHAYTFSVAASRAGTITLADVGSCHGCNSKVMREKLRVGSLARVGTVRLVPGEDGACPTAQVALNESLLGKKCIGSKLLLTNANLGARISFDSSDPSQVEAVVASACGVAGLSLTVGSRKLNDLLGDRPFRILAASSGACIGVPVGRCDCACGGCVKASDITWGCLELLDC